jgi:hypothetical protein
MKVIISDLLTSSSLHFITLIIVDLIVYEEQESKYLIVVKKGQCIKISNVENKLDKR